MGVAYTHLTGSKAHPANKPKHIAVVMDGNGRWATLRGMSRTKGHRKGVEGVREMVSFCIEHQIQVLTLFAFGKENWKRPSQEVRNLFRLFFLVLKKEINKLHDDGIRLVLIGDRAELPMALQHAMRDAEAKTARNQGLTLNVAVNYSGRWDIMNALKQMSTSMPQEADFESQFESGLALHGLPEPDLFIRTGGVKRISNFMLWELAYTELYFTDTLWPDFNREQMNLALADFAQRERRFGLTGEQLE